MNNKFIYYLPPDIAYKNFQQEDLKRCGSKIATWKSTAVLKQYKKITNHFISGTIFFSTRSFHNN